MKRKFLKTVSSALCISALFASAVQADMYKDIPVPNGDFELVTSETAPGEEGRPDFVRDVPLNWTVFAPTLGDAYKFGDLDPLMGTKAGQSADGFHVAADLTKGNVTYSGTTKITTNTLDPNSKHALFLDSYITPGINIWSDEVDVTEGKTYRLSVEYFTAGLFNPGIRFFDKDGNVFTNAAPVKWNSQTAADSFNARNSWLYSEYLNANTTAGMTKNVWSAYQREFVAPKGAVKARIAFTFLGSGSGINGKFVVDNVKLLEILETKLNIPNAAFDNGVEGITAGGAEISVAETAGSTLANGTNKNPFMRDRNNLSVKATVAGGRAETDFIQAFGEGTYWVRFDANYPEGSQYQYAVECFDAGRNQLNANGEILGAYASDLTLQNPKTVTGIGVLQPTEMVNDTTVTQDITFDVPANTEYVKIYFVGDANVEQPLYIDNLEGAYRRQETDTTYQVEITAGAGGTVDKAGAHTVLKNEQVTMTIVPEDGMYIKEISCNGVPVYSNIMDGVFVYRTDAVKENTNISVTFDKVPLPENIYSFQSAFDSPFAADGAVQPAGIVFSKAPASFGEYTRVECGVLLSEDGALSKEDYAIDSPAVIRAKAVASPSTENGHYGIRFFGQGIQAGKSYHTVAYAVYKTADGAETVLYGDRIVSFVPVAAE